MTIVKKISLLVLSLAIGILTALGAFYVYKLVVADIQTGNPFSVEQNSPFSASASEATPGHIATVVKPAQTQALPQPPDPVFVNGMFTFQQAIQKVSPSIVNVYTQTKVGKQIVNTYGSGIIMSADGYVLTNFHVVAGAKQVAVTLRDGNVYNATITGSDQLTDLSVLKINTTDYSSLVPIRIPRNPPPVHVGDVAIAIGNPLNLGQSATMGIVSALGRATLDKVGYQQLIQTDVALNTGNSGGALINTNGDLIGINSLIVNEAYGTQVTGLGFAIPAATAITIMNQIITQGFANHAYFGADIAVVTNAQHHTTAMINAVTPNGPADKAGIKVGDRLLSLNSQPITDAYSTMAKINAFMPHQNIILEVDRQGNLLTIPVELGAVSGQTKVSSINKPNQPPS